MRESRKGSEIDSMTGCKDESLWVVEERASMASWKAIGHEVGEEKQCGMTAVYGKFW